MSQENPPIKEKELKEQKEQKGNKAKKGQKKSGWWIVLRFACVFLFLILAFFGGAVAGFVVLGKQDISHVWDLNTWKHVYDLVFAP